MLKTCLVCPLQPKLHHISAVFHQNISDAVDASIDMIQKLQVFNAYLINNDYEPIKIGVGVNSGNITGTTLGRIGVGYVYADWYPQITWTTPGLGP
ncbi:MAG: hypothetical protein EBZ27_08675, partial [Rhodobacteraceae bacterium]|nr:hypothetical protein [Paracoccaceae bacterium]